MTEPNAILSALLEPEPATAPPPAEPAKVEPPADPSQAAKPAEPASEPDPIEPEPQGAESIKEYATRVGVKAKDLYALALPSGMTVSDLSDKAKDFEHLDTATVEHARTVAEFASQQLQFNQAVSDWSVLVQQGQATPTALANLQQQRANAVERAQLQTLEAIPEWRDPAVKTAEREQIGEFLSHFGFTKADNDGIIDPRTHAMMRYILTLENRFRDALGKVEAVKNKAVPAPGKPPSRPKETPGLNVQSAALLKGLQAGLNRGKH